MDNDVYNSWFNQLITHKSNDDESMNWFNEPQYNWYHATEYENKNRKLVN